MEENFKPLSRSEEILWAIITGESYTGGALSRIEEQLVRLKAAFDKYFG